jgi:hypothetical protein
LDGQKTNELERICPRGLRKTTKSHPGYVGVAKSPWLFLLPISLFAAQPKEFSLDGLKKKTMKTTVHKT